MVEVWHPTATRIAAKTKKTECRVLTKNLLDVSRKKSSEREPTDVHKLIEQVLSYTEYRAHAQGLKVVRDFEPSLPRISVDPRGVEQVFLNLILNAFHAMTKGGTLSITARQVQREMGSVLQLTFGDNGHGIEEQNLKEIFDPFFSTKEGTGGTGLGLFISQKIVESYQGTIAVESEKNKGTTFIVQFPALK